jgi:dipeptidyl aminopeptidase/acylaminoacyl peptidase|tara:strand:- start:8877 stop:11009 length:2133 start_codon:yes stop_codon:yes gene_type:complete
MKTVLLRVIQSLLLLAAAYGSEAAEPVGLTSESLWQWSYVADPQISPDGNSVAFVQVTTLKEEDRYSSDIWVAGEGGKKPFTTHAGPDSRPRWSPDGDRLAFISKRGEKAQIYILDVSGGEARQLTDMEEAVSDFAWSRDGTRIAFLSKDLTAQEREEKEARDDGRTASKLDGDKLESQGELKAKEEIVLESLKTRADGSPEFIQQRHRQRNHIWIVEVDGQYPGASSRITHGDYDDGTPHWSADGGMIYFSAIRKQDAEYQLGDSEIYRVAASGDSEPIPLTDHRGPDSRPLVSPDGKWIAFTGYDVDERPPSYATQELYVMRPDGSQRRLLTAEYERAVGDGVGSDVLAPIAGSSSRIQWKRDSKSLYFTSADRGQVNIQEVRVRDSRITPLTELEQGGILSFTVSGESELTVLYTDATLPAQVFTMQANRPQQNRWTEITAVNSDMANYSTYEEIWYESFDDLSIQGWVVRPIDFDPDDSYPLILYIHGGPHAMYGTAFFHEFQVLANAGYLVFITNPRGSTGYGTEFGNIIQYRYPGDDFKDLMAGVDELIERPYVDADRLGVAGGSGGGLLTAWTVGHTDRFKAAVTQRAVINWYSFVGTADLNYNFAERWFRDFPWGDADDYLSRSPIHYADQVTTPVLIIHSEDDFRVPLEQDLQFYTALKMQKKKAKLVLFPEESHGLSRAGRPSHRISRLNYILAWFDELL